MRRGLNERKRRRQVIGETAIWGAVVGLVGHAAFGLPGGLALALGFGTIHVRVRRLERDAPRHVVGAWHLVALPAVFGVTLAALPIVLLVIAAPALLGFWLATPLPCRLGPARRLRVAGLAVVAVTVLAAAISPKHLDRRVGPGHYRDVQVGELCIRLREDHDIRCHVDPSARTQRLDFDIGHPMTRRDVLRKLADETALQLRLGGCGTFATLLWGPNYNPRLSPRAGAP